MGKRAIVRDVQGMKRKTEVEIDEQHQAQRYREWNIEQRHETRLLGGD